MSRASALKLTETPNPPTPRAWREAVAELGPGFAERAAAHDADGSFVGENYAALRERKVFSAGVPAELGGGGATHTELCELVRELAHHCPSTALAFSMHTHLVATAVWRWRNTGAGEPLLRRVAAEELVLVSTGASDWVDSNGTMERVEGGYRVSARKVFGSGSETADLLITSARYDDPGEGPVVLHFPLAFAAEGVRVTGDWDAHGMRGTGSHTMVLDRVFVPEESISLRRPAGTWPPVLSVVVTVAMPIIISVYRGVAEAAVEIARRQMAKQADDPDLQRLAGEMENALLTLELAVEDMKRRAAGYDFAADVAHASRTLAAKTVATKAAITAVETAMEATGGAGFHRGFGLERLLRDVRAAHYHPLPESRQLRFTGRVALGLPPVG